MSQSNPGFTHGYVPTPAQWNSYFSVKTDAVGGTLTNGYAISMTVTNSTFDYASANSMLQALSAGGTALLPIPSAAAATGGVSAIKLLLLG